MAQRKSGYERKDRDLYETPEWVTQALQPHIPARVARHIWEPACASGKMARVLQASWCSDLVTTYGQADTDFLEQERVPADCLAIITNPPFNRAAEKFIRHGLTLLNNHYAGNDADAPFMAMLLPVDFDSAKTRRDMFADCPHFSRKLVLTSRIVWFERDDGTDNPSANHAWFIWDYDSGYDRADIRYHFRT
jgi:hypothetical protein